MEAVTLLMVAAAFLPLPPAAAVLDDRPRVRCESGHLRLESGSGKNITLSSRGSGAVVINGVDVAGSLSLVSAVRPQLEGLRNADLSFLILNLTQVARTVASNTWVSTSIRALNTSVTGHTNEVRTLKTDVTTIRTTLQERLDPLVTNVSRLSTQVGLITPDGSQRLQELNTQLTQIQQSNTETQQAIQGLTDQIVPQIQQNVRSLQAGVASLPTLQDRVEALESQANITGISGGSSLSRGSQRALRILRRRLRSLMSRLAVDECGSGPCQHGGTCIDGFRRYTCLCRSGWQGENCDDDVNECYEFLGTNTGCQNGATCTNTDGGYRCDCRAGYYGVHCTLQTNNCSSATGSALCGGHGVCVPSTGGQHSYSCICDEGWKPGSGSPTCVDVDECSSTRPHCSHDPPVQCVNYPGGYTCGPCPQGYTGNGFACRDVDECQFNNGGCSPYSVCYNTQGGRRCGPCSAGYTGDGVSCMPAPRACQQSPCHPLATCYDNPHMSPTFYQCVCPPGYQGSGIGPYGCTPGSPGGQSGSGSGSGQLQPTTNWCANQPCMNGGTCNQFGNTYTCLCQPGYTGRNCEVDIDECASHPCLHGGTCTQGVNSFSCQCPSSHTGDRCQTENEQCGGRLTGTEGNVAYPGTAGQLYNHNISCAWVISVPRGKVIEVVFHHFHLENAHCMYDWLQVHDGPSSSSHLFGRYCGSRLPGNNGTIISTHPHLYLWLRTDHSVAGYGFNFTWNATDPVCGYDVQGQEHGSIKSPGYPGHYPLDRDCYWSIQVRPGKRIKFLFATVQIEHHTTCDYDFLEIYDGLTDQSHSLGNFCSTATPAPVTTSGSEALIHFHSDHSSSDTGFFITFAAEPGIPGCGGLLSGDMGEFSAPTRSEVYQHNLHCEWLIRTPPGERVQLNFTEFHLEYQRNCRWDYVEVLDGGSADSPLITRVCGNTIPEPILSHGNQLFVVFHSDYSVSYDGFTATYQVACGGEFTGDTGLIRSPYHPQPYPHDRECIYIIRQPLGKAILLNFTDFDIEGPSYWRGCVYDYVELLDGRRQTSPVLGRYCGPATHRPDPILSTHNYMRIKFVTDASVTNRGFVANYTTIDTRCGGVMRDITGLINSPNSPETYPSNTDCTWVLDLPPGYVIQITWHTFALEHHVDCHYDYVEIFDNSSIPGMGGRMGERFCGSTVPPIMTSSDNLVTIHFHSDHSMNHDGFSAVYHGIDASRMCGGHYHTEAGMITSPNFPMNYPHSRTCEWTISAARGHQIRLTFEVVEIENAPNCVFDSLEIKNGRYPTSPLLTTICSRNKTVPELLSHTNELYLKFTSDYSQSYQGFKLFWDAATTGCGGSLTSVSGEIISPGYPQPYHHRADCYWTIHVSQGSGIRFHFIDLDLEDHLHCRFDFVEIRDGSNPHSPLVGRYCSSNQGVVTLNSTSSSLWIRFHSDYSVNGRGFKAVYSADCNRVLRGPRGVITTPNYPNPYPHRRNCTWIIQVPLGNSINASFSDFVLEESHDSETGLCLYDYVELREGKQGDPSRSRLGHYCRELPQPVATSTAMNILEVNFVSDVSVAENGFRLEWIINGCGGRLTKPSGNIVSPGYPNQYPVNTVCEWQIRTPPGTKVQITIHDFEIEASSECYFDVLRVYGGEDSTSPLLTSLCHQQTRPVVVTSQGNNALVTFHSDVNIRGKGFNISYSSLHGGCGGLFTAPQGSIHSPNYPHLYDPHSDCVWTIRVNPQHVVVLNFSDFDVEPSTNCSYDYLSVFDGEDEDAPLLLQHCGASMPTPALLRSSTNVLTVRLKADGSLGGRGFSANYSLGCGATLQVNQEGSGELVSTHYPDLYSLGLNCSWHLVAPSGNRIHLHVVHLDLHSNFWDNTNCTAGNLGVRDGGQLDSPAIGIYCGEAPPRTIFSSSEYLTVTLFSRYGLHTSFRAVYSVMTSACGGDLTSVMGELASPHYPEPYPNEADCEWSIIAGPGNRVQLNFEVFDLENSDNCNLDYVEVHEKDPTGRLLLHNCSSLSDPLPPSIVAHHSLWLRFRSDDSSSVGRGFLASYSLLFGSEIYGTSGEVVSPMYPVRFMRNEDVRWLIRVPRGKYVSIRILDLDVQGNPFSTDCVASLVFYNGPSAEVSPRLGSLCGHVPPPEPLVSSGSTVLVVLHGSQHNYGSSRFRFQFEAVDTTGTPGQTQLDTNSCSFQIDLNSTLTSFNNPGYPGYANNLDCEWILQAPPHERVKIYVTYDLEESYDCHYDRIMVYDGVEGTRNWLLNETLCLRGQWRHFTSSGRFLKIRFSTDSSVTRNGFTVYAHAMCGGYLLDTEGVITSPYYPNNYPSNADCHWIIKVSLGKTIRLEFDDFKVLNTTPTCGGDYLVIRNGGSESSPFLGEGKFCGVATPQVSESTSNLLRISFASDQADSAKGFKLRYYEQADACGGAHHLAAELPSVIITSPNYPNSPDPYTECAWVVIAPPEKSISLHFQGHFEIPAQYGECDQAYVEVRDGGTILSPILGKFCGTTIPDTMHGTSDALYVRYYNSISDHHAGFKAEVAIDTCGGTYNAWDTGTISSPGYPSAYAADVNCTWRIVAPVGHYLTLAFTEVDIFNLADNCTSPRGLLQIREKNATGEVLASLCSSGEEVLPVYTASNEAYITFRGGPNPANRKGFLLTFTKSLEECGGDMVGAEGEILSPGYPHGYSHRRECQWVITGPPGKRIKLEVLDSDLEARDYFYRDGETYHGCRDRLRFQNGDNEYAPAMYGNIAHCRMTPDSQRIFTSSMNKLRVTFLTLGHSHGRGFRLRWTSEDPQECGGELDLSVGALAYSTLQPEYSNRTLFCRWTARNPNSGNSSLLINVTHLQDVTHCYIGITIEGVNSAGEVVPVKKVCSSDDLGPVVIFHPAFRITYAKYKFSSSAWNLTYGVSQCGGKLYGPQDVITSPRYPAHYPNNVHCGWLFSYNEGEQIEFNFTNFRLENSLHHDYVAIHNGPRIASPVIGRYTGTTNPGHVGRSMTNKLVVEFHTDGNTNDEGFRAIAARHVRGCGGIFHGMTGNISSHGFPGDYEANIECTWEIESSTGYHIVLTFTDRFDIETSDNCQNDYIQEIHSQQSGRLGSPLEWVAGEKYCGKQLPQPIVARGSRVRLLFHSNEDVQGHGFKATWQMVCGNNYTSSSGYIFSPGYPQKYPNFAECDYRIVAPRDRFVTIHFLSFDVEHEGECRYDSLEVVEEINRLSWRSPRTWGPYCNGALPPDVITTRGPTTLRFRSDFVLQFAGFEANYTIEECGGTVNAPAIIQLPTRPSYHHLMRCVWNITAPTGKVPHFK
ncbi:cubilin-like [Panulirus ornatus]|uniref:cubilin-like n=1 Tax=Panulirus ornatus TaxID=150431 RepID=UPI003A894367